MTVSYSGDRVYGRSTGTLSVTVAKSAISGISLPTFPDPIDVALPFVLPGTGGGTTTNRRPISGGLSIQLHHEGGHRSWRSHRLDYSDGQLEHMPPGDFRSGNRRGNLESAWLRDTGGIHRRRVPKHRSGRRSKASREFHRRAARAAGCGPIRRRRRCGRAARPSHHDAAADAGAEDHAEDHAGRRRRRRSLPRARSSWRRSRRAPRASAALEIAVERLAVERRSSWRSSPGRWQG